MKGWVTFRVILIEQNRNTTILLHDFGEEIWLKTRENNRIIIDMKEVDHAREFVTFQVRESYIKQAEKLLAETLESNLLTYRVKVERSDANGPA